MSEITEQFVPYKQAEQLKELGFDEDCLGYYEDSKLQISQVEYIELDDNFYVLAPLYQQTFDWFREKYKLMIAINVSSAGYYLSFFKNEKFQYYFEVKIGEESYLRMKEYYITYQEAQLACLDKLISLVKEKK